MLDEVRMLPWFYGTLSRPESEKTLTRTTVTPGMALFRESRNNAVLSVYLHDNFFSHHVITRATANADIAVDDKPVPGCSSATQLLALIRDSSSVVTVPVTALLPCPAAQQHASHPAWLLGPATAGATEGKLRAAGSGPGSFAVRDGPVPGTFLLSVVSASGAVLQKELDFAPSGAAAAASGCTLDGTPLRSSRPLTSIGMVVAYLQGTSDPALPLKLGAGVS